MVEILYRGLPPQEREYTYTCPNCATRFRFKRSEAKYISDQRDGDTLEIPCPVCPKPCWVQA